MPLLDPDEGRRLGVRAASNGQEAARKEIPAKRTVFSVCLIMLARVNLNDTNLHEALPADKYNQTKYRYYFAEPTKWDYNGLKINGFSDRLSR